VSSSVYEGQLVMFMMGVNHEQRKESRYVNVVLLVKLNNLLFVISILYTHTIRYLFV